MFCPTLLQSHLKVGTLPVKFIPAKSCDFVKHSPNVAPLAGKKLITPGGNP